MAHDALAAELERAGRRRTYHKGDTLVLQGDLSDRVLLIIAGRVKISANLENGQVALLAIRGPGEVVGEFSALDGAPRAATATAIEDVEASIVAASEYMALLERRPDLAIAQLREMVQRLRETDLQRVEIAGFTVSARLAHRLLELARSYGEATEDSIRISIPLTQDELASWAGASREAVAKALRGFRDAGLIATGRKEIEILDPAGLERRAES